MEAVTEPAQAIELILETEEGPARYVINPKATLHWDNITNLKIFSLKMRMIDCD